jgi:hypothetical protein
MTFDQSYTAPAILDDCAALLEKHSAALPRPDAAGSQSAEPPIRMLWLAGDHGLRTIRGMARLLRDDERNVVLACTLLRPFYEFSIRLLWASREPDGWRRLLLYFATEIKKWANDCKDSPNPGIAELATYLLQRDRGVEEWKDTAGNTVRPAPSIRQILEDIVGHDAQQGSPFAHAGIGKQQYSLLYRILCRPSHAHIEAIGGAFNGMYSSWACIGGVSATAHYLTAFIHHTSQSAVTDVSTMLTTFGPLLQRCATHGASTRVGRQTQ